MKQLPPLLLAAALLAPLPASAVPPVSPPTFDNARYNATLSRLQAMGHGYYTPAEWETIDHDLDALLHSARAAKDGDAIIKTALVKAMVLADMRHLYPQALQELRSARHLASSIPNLDPSRLYVKEADILSQTGDAPAIETLIAHYKASPWYRPVLYPWSGGNGPADPILLARPKAQKPASLPLTMLERSLRAARAAAPGRPFPDPTLSDLSGRPFRLSDYRGRLLLVDFFVRGWPKWEQNLPTLRDLYARFANQNFAIVSICLQPNAPNLDQLALPWTLCPAQPQLTQPLGIFGESTTFLLDPNGTVIARNLYGPNLTAAIRSALGQ